MKSNSFSLFDFNPDSRKHIKNNNKKETATCPSSKYHPYPTPEWKFSARLPKLSYVIASNLPKASSIAESPKVISVAIDAGYKPLALLCEQKHITGDAATIIGRSGDIPVYTGTRELLATLTGYTLTRGVLCAMRRPTPLSLRKYAGKPGVS